LNPDLTASGFSTAGPVLGTEQAFANQTLTLGSSTAIACLLVQPIGLRTAMTALVAEDEYGRYCRDVLLAEVVDTSGLRTHPSLATGLTIPLS